MNSRRCRCSGIGILPRSNRAVVVEASGRPGRGVGKHADMPASGENGGSTAGYLIDGRVDGVSLRPPQRFATVHYWRFIGAC
jgi:hypothetical protein